MEKAEKWIFFMVGSVAGLFICSYLFKFINTGEPLTILGKFLLIMFGFFIAAWIVSFIEFIIVMVRNKRRKRGVR